MKAVKINKKNAQKPITAKPIKQSDSKNKVNFNKVSILLIVIFILLSFLISLISFNSLPETIITHWGINGEANGFSSKSFGLMFVPILTTILALVLIAIPKIDPLKKNIESFKEKYYEFVAIFVGFMLYIHTITILLNFGHTLNIIALLSPAFAVLMYYIGNLMGSAKRNYFIGIRTPWTLDSEIVWNKTHKLGEKAHKLSAIICLIGIILPNYALLFIIAPLIFTSLYLVAYSYFEHKKITKK